MMAPVIGSGIAWIELLGRHPRRGRLQPQAKLEGLVRGDEHLLTRGPVSAQSDLDLVDSGRQVESLEDSVKIVDRSGVCPVHIDLGLSTGLRLR